MPLREDSNADYMYVGSNAPAPLHSGHVDRSYAGADYHYILQ